MLFASTGAWRVAAITCFAWTAVGCSSSGSDGPGGALEASVVGTPPCKAGSFGVTRMKPGGMAWTSDTYLVSASTVDVATSTDGPSHYAVTFDGGAFDLRWTGPMEPSDPGAVTSVKTGTLSLPANDTFPASTWCVYDASFHRTSGNLEITFGGAPGDCPTGPYDGGIPPPRPSTIPINGCVAPSP